MQKLLIRSTILLSVALFISSCSTQKVVVNGEGGDLQRISTRVLLSKIDSEKVVIDSIKASRISVSITAGEEKTKKLKATYSSIRGDFMQLNAVKSTMSVAKSILTEDSIKNILYLSNNYQLLGWDYVTEMLGVDVGLEELQLLLLGRMVDYSEYRNYDITIEDSDYLLQPKEQKRGGKDLIQKIYIDGTTFNISKMEFIDSSKGSITTFRYGSYQGLGDTTVPSKIEINYCKDGKLPFILILDIGHYSLDNVKRARFKIPSSYKLLETDRDNN